MRHNSPLSSFNRMQTYIISKLLFDKTFLIPKVKIFFWISKKDYLN